jgi:hypothetical protein
MNECTLKIGDIITGYTPGYHVITDITERTYEKNHTNHPLISYTQILDEYGNKISFINKQQSDSDWCQLVTKEFFENQINNYIERMNKIQQALNIE